MQLTVLTGDDDLAIAQKRAELLSSVPAGPSGVETLDVSLDGGEGLVTAVSSPNLFGGVRVVAAEHLEALGEEHAGALALAAARSDAVVVARASGAIPPKVRKALQGCGELVSCATPRGRAVAGRVTELARASGVHLGAAERSLLARRGEHDLARVATILSQCAGAGIARPSLAQLEVLLGSTEAAGAPWQVTDALEEGDLNAALEAARRVEPVAVVSYLCTRAAQIARVIEAGPPSGTGAADAVKDELRLSHRFVAEKLLRVARRLDDAGLVRLLDVLRHADRAVKYSPVPAATLEVLLARLAPIFAPSAARERRD